MSDKNEETRRPEDRKDENQVKDLPSEKKVDTADAQQVKGGTINRTYLK